MYRIAVIGKQSDILGFMALGFHVEAAEDAETARQALHRLAKSEQYAVIFLAEDYASELEQDTAKYTEKTIPAIVVIPTAGADSGYGMNAISDAVKRAVGADIN